VVVGVTLNGFGEAGYGLAPVFVFEGLVAFVLPLCRFLH